MLLHILPTTIETSTCAYAIAVVAFSSVVGGELAGLTLLRKFWRNVLLWGERKYQSWLYLFRGPSIIQDRYNQSNGKPFEVFAPDNRYVFVSSAEQIKELDCAADTVLSLQAASKQMLQPKYSMHGFNWFDRRGTEGVGFIKALRTLLTNNMPCILPDLQTRISHEIAALFEGYKSAGASKVPIYPVIVRVTVVTNALAFFGPELANDDDFLRSALEYVENTIKIAEVVRLLPKFLADALAPTLFAGMSAQQIIYDRLIHAAEERLDNRSEKRLGKPYKEYNDCIQWIMETSPKQKPWDARRIVHELMAIWFGSVHAVSTTVTFAIHDLCLYPEYIDPLRNEFDGPEMTDFVNSARGLPLLDSFIKESARLTPVESMSTRRHALEPFTLKDGTRVETGDWACTPVRALMQNEADYPNALSFQGFRFADLKVVEEAQRAAVRGGIKMTQQQFPSKLTDTDSSFHVWGTGRMACPGRYYAAAIMKIMISEVVSKYDFNLVNPDAKRWWTWRSTMLPMKGTLIEFRSRS